MKTAFECKPDFRLRDFVIEKTVIVPTEVFMDMLKHPLKDRSFIAENIPLMHQDKNNVYHCLLVTGTGRADGILVGSDGYDYARYASYVPEVTALQYPSLLKWNRELAEAVDFIITDGISQSTEGSWMLSFEELENQTGLCLDGKPFLQEVLGDMLCDRLEVSDLTIDHGRIDVTYYLDFCPNCQETMQEESLEEGMKMQQ